MIPDYKCLVLTLRVECESAEAIMLLAHNPDGEPIPVYIELAVRIKGVSLRREVKTSAYANRCARSRANQARSTRRDS